MKVYMMAAFSAASWLPQKIKRFKVSVPWESWGQVRWFVICRESVVPAPMNPMELQ